MERTRLRRVRFYLGISAICSILAASICISLLMNPVFSNPPLQMKLKVVTDKSSYREGENMTITIRNVSGRKVFFGSTAYGVRFEKWNGEKWKFHSSIIGAAVIVSLEPGQTKQITVELSNPDQPFTAGKYRVLSNGWIEQDGKHIQISGYSEFSILE